MTKIIITLFLISVLYSCSMTPAKKEIKYDYKIKKNYSYNEDNRKKNKEIFKEKWWKKFNDDTLNKLIEKVLKNNLDLKTALENVNLLRIQYNLSKVKKLPVVNLSGGYNKTRTPVMGFNIDRNTGKMTKVYTPQTKDTYNLKLGAAFELDLFDKYGSLTRSALNNLKSAEAEYKKFYFLMISQTIISYFDIYFLKKSIDLTKESIELYKNELEIGKSKYESGLESIFNINSLNQNIYSLKVNLEDLKNQLKLRKMTIKVLQGKYPDFNFDFNTSDKDIISKLEDLSKGVPSDLLKNRFDIISAKYKLDSAREMIGYSKADRFPSISLSAVAGFLNLTALDHFFDSDFITVGGGVDINYTVFSYGSKENAYKKAVEQYNIALLNYKKTVLNAFKEVEEILIKTESLKKKKELLEKSLQIAVSSYEDAKNRYEGGTGDYRILLDLSKAVINIKLSLINMEKAIVISYIDLYRALGKR